MFDAFFGLLVYFIGLWAWFGSQVVYKANFDLKFDVVVYYH
jgi:hypothetical protein